MKKIMELMKHEGEGTFIPKDQMIVTVKDNQILLYPPAEREDMPLVEEAVAAAIHKLSIDSSFAADMVKWLREDMKEKQAEEAKASRH